MSLDILKERLESVLNESTEAYHFKNAIEDAIYSTVLDSVTALEQWISIWVSTDSHVLTETEIQYQEGVQFVADIWNELNSCN